MRRYVIQSAIMLIGVVVSLHNISSITAYAKEDDEFLMGGVQSITHI